jgi:hypothetical protein
MTLYQLKIFEAVARHANIMQAVIGASRAPAGGISATEVIQDKYGVRFLNQPSHGVEWRYLWRAKSSSPPNHEWSDGETSQIPKLESYVPNLVLIQLKT